MSKVMVFLMLLGNCAQASAELDSPSQEALETTVKAMTNPNEREKAFRENPKFKEGDSGADLLVNGNAAQKQQIYELAAKVLQGLAQKSNGDAKQMQEIVSKASQDPGKFMEEYLTPEQKKQVRELAGEIEKGREPKSPSPSK